MDNFADLLALLKVALGITDNSRDAELTALLEGAIVLCETYTDDIIDRRAVTQSWVSGYSPFLLRYRAAADLSSVEYDGDTVTDEWELLLGAGYAQLIRVDRVAFPLDCRQFNVEYTAGFASCPYDLMLAIRDTAAYLDSLSGVGAPVVGTIKRETVTDVGTVEYETGSEAARSSSSDLIPSRAIGILERYRRVGV